MCDSGDGSGTEEEINKPGCLRADAVSKPTTTDLSAHTKREREREVKTNAEREREGKCERLVGRGGTTETVKTIGRKENHK